MSEWLAGFLLFIIVVGSSAALNTLSKGSTGSRKQSVKIKCPDCGHTWHLTEG